MTPGPRTRQPLWRRYLRIAAGFAILLVGIVLALPLVPGPGIPLILLGLLLLSDHFAWAGWLLAWAKNRWHQASARLRRFPPTDDRTPKSPS